MPKLTINLTPAVFNEVYLPYTEKRHPTEIFYGGSSSGKSVFLAQRAVLDILRGGRNYLVLRKVARTVRHSVFNEIRKVIATFQLQKFFTVNKAELMITCSNGYQILFGGLDDPEKVKSLTAEKGVITDVWLEEATETTPHDYRQMTKRLRGKDARNAGIVKRVVMSFNPILQTHWIYETFFHSWDDSKKIYEDEDLLILKTIYKDNKFLTVSDIQRLENEEDHYYYEVYTLGKWGVLGNLIFTNWETRGLAELKKETHHFFAGQDFGFTNDPSATILGSYNSGKKELYIFEEVYEKGLSNEEIANRAKPIVGNTPLVCDSAEPKSIAELKKMGLSAIPARKGKDSVNQGIDWLKRQKIIVDPVRCPNLVSEFKGYKWKEDKDGRVLNVPVDRSNHGIDALRYGVEEYSSGTGEVYTQDFA